MLRILLIGLALGAAATPQGLAAQQPDSASHQRDDQSVRSRIRIRTRPNLWRFQTGFPRTFAVQPRWHGPSRFAMAPKFRWRGMTQPRFNYQFQQPFGRLRFRPDIQGWGPRGWARGEHGRYRTI